MSMELPVLPGFTFDRRHHSQKGELVRAAGALAAHAIACERHPVHDARVPGRGSIGQVKLLEAWRGELAREAVRAAGGGREVDFRGDPASISRVSNGGLCPNQDLLEGIRVSPVGARPGAAGREGLPMVP